MGAPESQAKKEQSADHSVILCGWVEEHGDYLFRYALRHFRNRSDAEELVQEAFLAAVQGVMQFQGTSAARTWLTGILRHKIIDRIRKRQSERATASSASAVDAEEIPAGLFDSQEHWTAGGGPREWNLTPDAAFERKDFYEKLNQCLYKLPEKFRVVFLLRELDGMSRDEIGEQSGLTANNIGVMLHRARLMLRECLQQNWLEPSA